MKANFLQDHFLFRIIFIIATTGKNILQPMCFIYYLVFESMRYLITIDGFQNQC